MKLNKQLKKDIAHAIIVHSKLPEQIEKSTIELKEYGNKVFEHLMKEYMPHINKLPSDLFKLSNTFRMTLKDGAIKLETAKQYPNIPLYSYHQYPIAFENSVDDPIIVQYLTLQKQLEELHNKHSKAIDQTNSILESVSTYKQLCEVWEEVEPIVKKFYRPKGNALIVADIAQTNTLLNLTKK